MKNWLVALRMNGLRLNPGYVLPLLAMFAGQMGLMAYGVRTRHHPAVVGVGIMVLAVAEIVWLFGYPALAQGLRRRRLGLDVQ